MSYTEFIEDFWNDRASQIQTGLIGKIQKFDKQKMRADVQPLLKLKNAINESIDYPILADVPVLMFYGGGFYVRPVYQTGDIVWIGFSTFDIDNSLNGYSRNQSEKLFGIENAVIIGGVAKNNFKLPNEFSSDEGLLIGSDNGNSYIKFSEDSIEMKFSGGQTIKFSSSGIEADGQIIAGLEMIWNNKSIPTHASTHVHTGNLGAPTSAPTPGS